MPRHRATDQEPLKDVLRGSAATVNDPQVEAEMKTSTGLGRMVDMRVPLWHIVTALSIGGFTLISMWFSVQSLTTAMAEVQATLKSGNSQSVQTLLEIDRLKGRLDRAEETYRDIQAQIIRQQMQQPGKGGQ